MIIGRFDDWGRPILRARLLIPRLGISALVIYETCQSSKPDGYCQLTRICGTG